MLRSLKDKISKKLVIPKIYSVLTEDQDSLRDLLREAFGHYYILNDKTHREQHFEDVYNTAILINGHLALGYNENLILLASYLHDLFAWNHQEHHKLAAEFVLDTNHPLLETLSKEDRRLLADACYYHKSNYKGEFPSKFAELINAADRGTPTSAFVVLQQAIDYRISCRYKGNTGELIHDAVTYVKEKYGTKGYARYSQMYLACFEPELRKFQREVDRL